MVERKRRGWAGVLRVGDSVLVGGGGRSSGWARQGGRDCLLRGGLPSKAQSGTYTQGGWRADTAAEPGGCGTCRRQRP